MKNKQIRPVFMKAFFAAYCIFLASRIIILAIEGNPVASWAYAIAAIWFVFWFLDQLMIKLDHELIESLFDSLKERQTICDQAIDGWQESNNTNKELLTKLQKYESDALQTEQSGQDTEGTKPA